MEISIHTKLSRLLLILRGAVSMVELEGLQIASILTKHGDVDLSLAFHEIGNALYLARDTVSFAMPMTSPLQTIRCGFFVQRSFPPDLDLLLPRKPSSFAKK